MTGQDFRPEESPSMEKPPVDSGVVKSYLINGPNRDTSSVIFRAVEMSRTGDHLEIYLADDPNPVEIHFPTEDFVAFRREVSTDQVFSKGRAEIDLLDDMYPQGPGVSWAGDRAVSLSLGRGRDNFDGLGSFETSGVSRKHCQISFELLDKILIIQNFEDTTNQTEVVRKHQEVNIDDLVSSTDNFASPESESPPQLGRGGILKKHFERFIGKPEETPKLFKDYAATSKEAIYRDTFLENEDRHVIDEKAGVFAVFDGMGGGKGGALAADIASEVARRSKGQRYRKIDNPQEALDDLAEMIEDMNTAILSDRNSYKAGTTATAIRLIGGENGVTSLAWVNVGDSRLYVSKKGGLPEQVTTDEVADNVPEAKQGSVLTNCLGWVEGAFRGVRDSGILEVSSGDRIILCTDGVTGDKGSELMYAPEIHELVAGLSAKEAVQSLIENARKIDDRTALVVDL